MESLRELRTLTRASLLVSIFVSVLVAAWPGQSARAEGPQPLLATGKPVEWWFVFKLNAGKFPGCRAHADRTCLFGGEVQEYSSFSQQYAVASSDDPTLQQGDGCAGDTLTDPIGATFNEIYNGDFHYVVWNDQFYQDPQIPTCSGDSCGSPWGHSKGMLVWNDSGEGVVLQVTTPSWPGAGSALHARTNGDNTLGCILNNNVKFSQHFFALSLTHEALLKVLRGLVNASVVTNPTDPQIVSNGGPADVRALVERLGKRSGSTIATIDDLATHIRLISKPSKLHVPPWQLVSAMLGRVPLRAATWWTRPEIPSTTASTHVKCWDGSLPAPAAVEIATAGAWNGTTIALKAGPSADGNHAKIGVSTGAAAGLTIFGDLNQQGAIDGDPRDCGRSQNGRGGLFFVIEDAKLASSVTKLIRGQSAPTE